MGELRAKLVGAGKHIRNSGGPTAQTPHHTQYHRPHHTKLRHTHSAVENPQRRRRCTNSAAQTRRPARQRHVALAHDCTTDRPGCRYAEGPTWRSTPRHIPSTQCEFSQMTPHELSRRRYRASVARAVFPCTTPTVRSQPCGSPQVTWEFSGTLHPGVDAPRS